MGQTSLSTSNAILTLETSHQASRRNWEKSNYAWYIVYRISYIVYEYERNQQTTVLGASSVFCFDGYSFSFNDLLVKGIIDSNNNLSSIKTQYVCIDECLLLSILTYKY